MQVDFKEKERESSLASKINLDAWSFPEQCNAVQCNIDMQHLKQTEQVAPLRKLSQQVRKTSAIMNIFGASEEKKLRRKSKAGIQVNQSPGEEFKPDESISEKSEVPDSHTFSLH